MKPLKMILAFCLAVGALAASHAYADDVRGVHADDQLAQRRVDELRHGRVRAAVVRFAPADQAPGSAHLHHHGVALDGGADAQRDPVSRRDREGGRVGLHFDDLEVLRHETFPGTDPRPPG